MKTAPSFQSPTAMRWLVAFALLMVDGLLLFSLFSRIPLPTDALHTLCLLLIALSAYTWVLYPFSGAAWVNAIVLVSLGWAWGVRQTVMLQLELAAFIVLTAAAAWQQQRRGRRLLRLQQVLDDLSEEQTVKDNAVALARQTREALQKKLSRYAHLQSIAEELSGLMDKGAIAELAVERAFALIGKSDACLLFIVDEERQELSLLASKKRERIGSIRTKHGDQFDRHLLRTHRPLLVNDVRRDFRFTVTLTPERQVQSIIASPLLLDRSLEGLLRLDSPRTGAYTQDDLRFLDILLDLVATAIMNAKLFARTQQLAVTDGLTGLTLRRPFLEQLTRELIRSARSREPVSILMLDIDHFKAYNDTFGHMAGDRVLKEIAQLLQSVVPAEATIARYGGEEFIVLLPRLARHQAADVAEKIRQKVEQEAGSRVPGQLPSRPASARAFLPLRGDRPSRVESSRGVTVSLGVAQFPDDAQAELELIRVADQRLYQAKRSGRNLVCSS